MVLRWPRSDMVRSIYSTHFPFVVNEILDADQMLTICTFLAEYKPILEQVEKILAEAGLDEDEMRRSAVTGTGGNLATEQSRNRR